MKLRTLTLLIVSLLTLVLVLSINALTSRLVMHSYARLEREDAFQNVERARNAYEHLIQELHTRTTDWADWDDTYKFMQDHNKEYVESNLVEQSLNQSLHVDAILYIDTQQRLFHAKAVQRMPNIPAPHAERLAQQIGLLATSPTPHRAKTDYCGAAQENGQVIFFSARPIRTSEMKGPVRGWLVFARYFTEETLQKLAERTRLNVSISNLTAPHLTEEIQQAKQRLERGAVLYAKPLTDTQIAGYTLLRDLYQKPTQLLRVELPRNIYAQGRESARYLLALVLAASALFSVATLLLLERFVLSRVVRLTRQVERIGAHESDCERVHLPGRDELGRLAGQINQMLTTLDESAGQVRASEERLRQYNENLEETVHERTRQLEDKNVALGQAEAEMRSLAHLQQAILDSANHIIISTDVQGVILTVNAAGERLLGYSEESVRGSLSILNLHTPGEIVQRVERLAQEFNARFEFDCEALFARAQRGLNDTAEWTYRRQDGGALPVLLSITALRNHEGGVTGFLFIAEDITERKSSERAMKRLHHVLTNAVEGIAQLDLEGRYVTANTAYAQMLGYEPEELSGRFWTISTVGKEHARLKQAYRHMIAHGKAELETLGQRQDGSNFHQQITLILSKDEHGETLGFYCFMKDISERKALEAKITHQAFHDALTGLPNRALFHERVEQALANANGVETEKMVAALFIDLDNFKFVNDSMGHEEGDRLLVTVAEALRECVRPGDLVARLGGDEFTILLEEVASADAAVAVARRVLARLRTPIVLEGGEVAVTPSIGIALSSSACRSREELLRDADTAMYEAKANGKAGYVLFDQRMMDRITERMELEAGLRHAVENDELRLYYQPIVDLETGAIVGAEALVRWEHPTLGLISPARFIPIAEETGQIIPIGAWVLEEACRQAKAWQQLPDYAQFKISVNLSARQLQPGDIADRVARTLLTTGLAPACLQLEITESMMLSNAESVLQRMRSLKELGLQLAMDDFGTGYSSLSYLQRLPLDTVKIDQSFVRGMGAENQPAVIVLSVIRMCRGLGMTVVCEGIETEEQMRHLQLLGCDLGQGYHFSRPVISDGFAQLLQHGVRLTAAPLTLSETESRPSLAA